AAFLLAAVIPTALAGAIGVYLSLQALKTETLRNLNQEVTVRSQGIGRFFDQLSAELLYLANARGLVDVVAAKHANNAWLLQTAVTRLERDYAALASLYPHIYQIRLIAADGQEWVRVDRKPDGVQVVPRNKLQSKGDRYYFRDAMAVKPGQIYVSPLDLNVEFGKVEKPERPVIRVATPVAGPGGGKAGVLIINLHADVLLEQVQQMATARQGTAYLFDAQKHYVSRSSSGATGAFSMEPMENLKQIFPKSIVDMLTDNGPSPNVDGGWIVAHASIDYAPHALAENSQGKWRIALAFPEKGLFFAVFSLYSLYAVLFVAMVVTALSGYALSRRLLRPLEDLSNETEAIASGDFSRRVNVMGNDEIAALGNKFNSMAGRLQASSETIQAHRDRLEEEVRARTRELEQERSSLEAVIEHTADGILAIDRDGVIQLLNPAATRLFNHRAVAPGTRMVSLWPQWPDIAQDALTGQLRCDVQLPDQVITLAVTPTTVGFIVVARDVSHERVIQDERRELDRQMFQMEKLTTLGELAMGLAHEIGNPLAGMKAVAQAMQYEEELSPGMIEALKRLESEVDRLSGFLRSFHGFAAPQMILSEACDLGHILDDVLFWTRKDAKSRDISFVLTGISTLAPLRADPHQLKQVFLNLLINAVHALPAGGTVTIDASDDGKLAKIRIRDTGIGIEPAVLNRIFEPFFTTRREGTGLGLAIVRKIVLQHGGTIEVSSNPGHGTCFTLIWPLAGEPHV
ncbi:MAG: ATP-binding protein, partial [Rhodoferax sp.]